VAKRKPRNRRHTVDENCIDLIEAFEPTTDRLEVCLRVVGGRRKTGVRPTDPARQIAAGLPIIDPNRRYGEIDHGEIAGLDVDKQHAIKS
jgi:hypothetical protein